MIKYEKTNEKMKNIKNDTRPEPVPPIAPESVAGWTSAGQPTGLYTDPFEQNAASTARMKTLQKVRSL